MVEGRPVLPLVALLALAGCDFRHGGADAAGQDAARMVPCALAGARQFTPGCWWERAGEGKLRFVVIHNPDGSYHRFRQVGDGRGLIPADGADKVVLTQRGNKVEVTIAGDRYILPARVRSHATAQ